MSFLRLLRTRQWVWGRRVALVGLVIILGLRNYGSTLSSWLKGPDREHDVVITKFEFRPDLGQAKPAWIIGLRNTSSRYTYDQIELEATYKDSSGKLLATDNMIVRHKLVPGDEQVIASTDIKSRPGATTGTLRVLGATSAKP
jgi:hypothetical protein